MQVGENSPIGDPGEGQTGGGGSAYGRGMSSEPADHFVQFQTPRGSTVVIHGFTAAQRDELAKRLTEEQAEEVPPPGVVDGKGETKTCTRCGGAGGGTRM